MGDEAGGQLFSCLALKLHIFNAGALKIPSDAASKRDIDNRNFLQNVATNASMVWGHGKYTKCKVPSVVSAMAGAVVASG